MAEHYSPAPIVKIRGELPCLRHSGVNGRSYPAIRAGLDYSVRCADWLSYQNADFRNYARWLSITRPHPSSKSGESCRAYSTPASMGNPTQRFALG